MTVSHRARRVRLLCVDVDSVFGRPVVKPGSDLSYATPSLKRGVMPQYSDKTKAEITDLGSQTTARDTKLPLEVQSEVESGALSFGHAKVLLMLDSADAQKEVAKRVIEGALSVRQTEDVVYQIVNPTEKPARRERQVDPNVREAEREIQRVLGVHVRIDDRQGKGKIVLEYASLEDFDRILGALKK